MAFEPTPSATLRRLAERYATLLQSTLEDRLVSVVLFGSVARGEATASSDIDLLIVADDLPTGQFARKRLLASADAAFEPALAAAAANGVDTRLVCVHRCVGSERAAFDRARRGTGT